MRAIICDLDGTLADCRHRLHHVLPGANRDWDKFFAEMSADTVIEPVRDVVRLSTDQGDYYDSKIPLILSTGRPENYRPQTERWLWDVAGLLYEKLYMRPANDTRPDHVVKREMLDRIRADGYEPFIVIDDRPSVVAMWREAGLVCLQAQPGELEIPKTAVLTLMVGPSGAGKSEWVQLRGRTVTEEWKFDEWAGWYYTTRITKSQVDGIEREHVLSSDQFRADLCGGDFKDQSKNVQVFEALHAVAKARLKHGLPVVIDATHLRRKDRLSAAQLVPAYNQVRYVVIDRPLEEKLRTRGWRSEELIKRHDQSFRSQINDILRGDGLPNVTVHDLRKTDAAVQS